jgi:hypothetical protein
MRRHGGKSPFFAYLWTDPLQIETETTLNLSPRPSRVAGRKITIKGANQDCFFTKIELKPKLPPPSPRRRSTDLQTTVTLQGA